MMTSWESNNRIKFNIEDFWKRGRIDIKYNLPFKAHPSAPTTEVMRGVSAKW